MPKQEKPYRIYLDQNIHDDLVKGRYSITSEQDFSVAYSVPTLEEIARTPKEYRTKFLSVLEEYDAEYMWLEDNLAYFKQSDPFEYLDNLNKYPSSKEMRDIALKLHGGKSGVSFNELISNQKSVFKQLMKVGVEELDEEEKEKLSPFFDLLEQQGNIVFDMMQNQLESTFPENEVPNLRKELENVTGLSAQQLNNIVAPNIVESIFNKIKEKNPELNQFNSVQNYFDWDLYNVEENDTFGKINVMFNFLNIVGYQKGFRIVE